MCDSVPSSDIASNLDTTQDMYKFNDKMLNGNGLQGLTCLAAPFWNLLGLRTWIFTISAITL